MKNQIKYLQLLLVLCSLNFCAQRSERPFILVKNSDRLKVLEKIDSKPWANEIYSDLKKMAAPRWKCMNRSGANCRGKSWSAFLR